MTPADIYLQPEAPDPLLSDEHVRTLIARHVEVASDNVKVDESGGEARTYLCGDWVLKTQRPHRLRPRTSLAKEAFILEEIQRQRPLRVPTLKGYGRDGDVEYEVLTRMPGVTLRDANLSVPARSRILAEVGRELRSLHNLDQVPFVESRLIPGDDTANDVQARLLGQFDDACALREDLGSALPQLTQLREHVAFSSAATSSIVVLHSNPGAEHCFVDIVSESLNGLIDFGDAYRSHPALDVRSWRSFADSREILEGYASSGDLPEGFLDVWRAGIIVSELRLLVHDYRTLAEVCTTLEELNSDRS